MSQPQPVSPDVQAALEALVQEYYRSLPERLSEIRGAWERCGAEPVPGETFSEFYRLIHSMAGKSGTFGMASVGRAARSLEKVLQQFIDGQRMPNPKEREVIAEWLGRLADMCAPYFEGASPK